MSTSLVKLKNGSSEPGASVGTSMLTLKDLWGSGIDGICAVSDLYERCRNPSHSIAAGELKTLKTVGLVKEDGSVHATIRNVVLSAISGDGADLELGEPAA